MYVKLEGYVPPPQTDPDEPEWVGARIEELIGTTWTPVGGTFELDPPITDPANPPAYSFVSDEATQGPGGRYRIVWIDADGGEVATPPSLWAAFRPSVDDVAARLLARTRSDSTGKPVGTFTQSTIPTAAKVESFIDDYVAEIALIVKGVRDPDVLAFARGVVAVAAAADVELSLDPDRAQDDTSAYARLVALYERRLELLREQVRAALDRQGAADNPGRSPGSVRVRSSLVDDLICDPYYADGLPL